ncbi:hypothetical protein D3C86_1813060 [compost metagenome]
MQVIDFDHGPRSDRLDRCLGGDAGDHRSRRFALQHQNEITNALTGLGQLLFPQGKGQAHKTLRRFTEGGRVQHRYLRFTQQPPGELQRSQASAAHVHQHEHPGIRRQH